MPPSVPARDVSPFKNSFLSPTPPNLTSACHYGDLELAPTVARQQGQEACLFRRWVCERVFYVCVLQVSILLNIQYKQTIPISTPYFQSLAVPNGLIILLMFLVFSHGGLKRFC